MVLVRRILVVLCLIAFLIPTAGDLRAGSRDRKRRLKKEQEKHQVSRKGPSRFSMASFGPACRKHWKLLSGLGVLSVAGVIGSQFIPRPSNKKVGNQDGTHPCSKISNEIYYVSLTHNEVQKDLFRTLLPLYKSNKIAIATEGLTYGQTEIFERLYGSSENAYGLEGENLMLLTMGTYLVQSTSRFLEYDPKSKDKAILDKAADTGRFLNDYIVESIKGFMFDKFRDFFRANKTRFPKLTKIVEKHGVLEKEWGELDAMLGHGSKFRNDAKVDVRLAETDRALVSDWRELGKALIEDIRKTSNLDSEMNNKLDSFLADPTGPKSSGLRNAVAFGLRDKAMLENLGKICERIKGTDLPLFVAAGFGHGPALVEGMPFTKTFGYFPRGEINYESDVVAHKERKVTDRGMKEAIRFLQERFGQ